MQSSVEYQYQEIRECLLSNLQLLQFEDSPVAVKNGISLDSNSFVLPNKKAYEAVMFFLFSKLDSSHNKFRDCWPIRDRAQEVDFRKICVEWLGELEVELKFPRNVGQLLIFHYGRKFCTFLEDFSSFILMKELQNLDSVHCLEPSILVQATNRQWKEFQNTQTQRLEEYGAWKMQARTELKKISFYKEKIMELSNRFHECSAGNVDNEMHHTISGQSVMVMKHWSVMDEACLRVDRECKSANYYLSREYRTHRLDGANLCIAISGMLLNEAHRFGITKLHLNMLNYKSNINLITLVDIVDAAFQLLLQKHQEYLITKANGHIMVISEVLSSWHALRHSSCTFNARLLTTHENMKMLLNMLLEDTMKTMSIVGTPQALL